MNQEPKEPNMDKTDNITLLRGDCLDILPTIADKSVDAVICDLPYGTTSCRWDVVIPFAPLWAQLNRVCKGAIALFATEPFTSELIMSNRKMYKQKLTWLKTRPTNVFNAKKQFMNWTEDIVVFYKKLPVFNPQMRTDGKFSGMKIQRNNHNRSNGVFGKTCEHKDYIHKSNGGLFYPKSVLEFSNVHNGNDCYHPTQKPVALLEYLIKTYTNEGDCVLDATMGSGSTMVACANAGRRGIGIELMQEYYDIAVKRVKDAQAQPKLDLAI